MTLLCGRFIEWKKSVCVEKVGCARITNVSCSMELPIREQYFTKAKRSTLGFDLVEKEAI